MGYTYSLEGEKWGSAAIGSAGGTVTWSMATGAGSYFSWAGAGLGSYAADVSAAFARWEQVANIHFVQVADSTRVNIRLGSSAIDGQWQVLGETIYSYSGSLLRYAEIAFDAAEQWTHTMFYEVALHEIGHALGLDHHSGDASIMAAYLNLQTTDLQAYDIAAIQYLYGGRGNNAPVIAASDYTIGRGQSVAASVLFSATDPDGQSIVKYQIWDDNPDPASGHWVLNGVAQAAQQNIAVTSAQLGQLRFQSGTGSDILYVRAFDGSDWGEWKGLTVSPVNRAAVVLAADVTPTHGQTTLSVASLFSITDPDGDAVTRYQFWDSIPDVASGHFVLNGSAQGANQAIEVAAGQLAQISFSTGSITDDLWVRAFDGFAWSAWKQFHVNPPANNAPLAVAPDFVAVHGQTSLAVAPLFTIADADGDAISRYQFWDSTPDPASGHFVLNGVAQGFNQAIDLAAGQLAQTSFAIGSTTDDLWVRGFDGFGWGAWEEFHVSPGPNQKPVTAALDMFPAHGQINLSAASLFTVADADADAITRYQFWDSSPDPASGHFVLNGVAQGVNQTIDVAATQLAQATFSTGSVIDDLWVRAFDGQDWGAWTEFHVSPAANHAPVAFASDVTPTHGQTSLPVASLFSVADADGDAIGRYQLWDSIPDPKSGHFSVNGVAQVANQAIDISAGQLARTTYAPGSTADDLWVRAYDGFDWGAWKEFHISAPTNQAPLVASGGASLAINQSVGASSLFQLSDPDRDSIVHYQLWDSDPKASSGHFAVNGVAQAANQAIDLSPAQLTQTTFVAGSVAGTDQLWVKASDGMAWSDWHAFDAVIHI